MFQLPKRKILVQKPVEGAKLNRKGKAFFDTNCNDGDVYTWEVKYDGCHMIIICDWEGQVHLFSRQGEPVHSCGHIGDRFLDNSTRGKVFFAEVWSPYLAHTEINGAFRRHSTQTLLSIRVFDMVPLDSFMEGECSMVYATRRAIGYPIITKLNLAWAEGFQSQQECDDYVSARRAEGVAFATDGRVCRHLFAGWSAGPATSGETVKMKPRPTYDLRVRDIVEGTGKWAGQLGSFVCLFGDEVINVQRGKLTDAECIELLKNPPHGRIIEVAALGVSEYGKLREPRFERWRDDKLPHEVD